MTNEHIQRRLKEIREDKAREVNRHVHSMRTIHLEEIGIQDVCAHERREKRGEPGYYRWTQCLICDATVEAVEGKWKVSS